MFSGYAVNPRGRLWALTIAQTPAYEQTLATFLERRHLLPLENAAVSVIRRVQTTWPTCSRPSWVIHVQPPSSQTENYLASLNSHHLLAHWISSYQEPDRKVWPKAKWLAWLLIPFVSSQDPGGIRCSTHIESNAHALLILTVLSQMTDFSPFQWFPSPTQRWAHELSSDRFKAVRIASSNSQPTFWTSPQSGKALSERDMHARSGSAFSCGERPVEPTRACPFQRPAFWGSKSVLLFTNSNPKSFSRLVRMNLTCRITDPWWSTAVCVWFFSVKQSMLDTRWQVVKWISLHIVTFVLQQGNHISSW